MRLTEPQKSGHAPMEIEVTVPEVKAALEEKADDEGVTVTGSKESKES